MRFTELPLAAQTAYAETAEQTRALELTNALSGLVGSFHKLERKVRAERAVGNDWVVTSGLRPGDKVIVQGLAKIRPGAPIRPVPASKPQVIAAPRPDKQS